MGVIDENRATYYRVSAGKVRKTAKEGDEGAIKRMVDLKEGGTKEIWEIVKKGIRGRIDSLKIDDGTYGRTIVVGINDGFEEFFLNIPYESSYARTFLEKVNAVNLGKDASIIPYSFIGDKGKPISGISIYQDENKIMSYYKEYDEEGKKVVGFKHDYPHGEDGIDKDEWKIIGIKQMKFLKENVVDCFGLNQAKDEAEAITEDKSEAISDEKDDLPF